MFFNFEALAGLAPIAAQIIHDVQAVQAASEDAALSGKPETLGEVLRDVVQELAPASEPPPPPDRVPMGPQDIRELVTQTLRDELPHVLRDALQELRAHRDPAPETEPTADEVKDPPPPAD